MKLVVAFLILTINMNHVVAAPNLANPKTTIVDKNLLKYYHKQMQSAQAVYSSSSHVTKGSSVKELGKAKTKNGQLGTKVTLKK